MAGNVTVIALLGGFTSALAIACSHLAVTHRRETVMPRVQPRLKYLITKLVYEQRRKPGPPTPAPGNDGALPMASNVTVIALLGGHALAARGQAIGTVNASTATAPAAGGSDDYCDVVIETIDAAMTQPSTGLNLGAQRDLRRIAAQQIPTHCRRAERASLRQQRRVRPAATACGLRGSGRSVSDHRRRDDAQCDYVFITPAAAPGSRPVTQGFSLR
jgi:hypothetical protein